jgi:hypothetical protein
VSEKKIKHLEFIQNIIMRMSNHSFLLKGWSVTIVSALFALAAKDSNPKFVLISYIVIVMFWVLDGFFLSTERKYRDLFNTVRSKTESEIDFDLNISTYKTFSNGWLATIFSKTLFPFYGSGVIAIFIIASLIND